MKLWIIFIACTVLFPAFALAEGTEETAQPPLLTQKQVEMLYYVQQGEVPSAKVLRMDEADFITQYNAVQELAEKKQFTRWKNHRLLPYIGKQDCQPLGTFPTTHLGRGSSVEVIADNPSDFICAALSSDANSHMKAENLSSNDFMVLSTFTLGEASLSDDGKRTLHVHVDKMDVYSKDKKTLLLSINALVAE